MPEPLVSFVVLSCNYARFLNECLESIFRQRTSVPFEIIVVDDASSDESEKIIRSHADSRLHFIRHEENLGHAATVTDGLKAARGKFVARIDCDDRYRPNFLEATLPIFEKFPEVGLIYGNAAIINEKGENTGESEDFHGGMSFKGNELAALLEKNFICSPTVIARREAWLKTLPIPEGLSFHDWYFTLMMAREWEFYCLPRVLADYRVHSANLHSTIIRNKKEEPSIFYLLDKIYSTPEKSVELERDKQKARNKVYSTHWMLLADKYFGNKMREDAKRCYGRVLRYRLLAIVQPEFLRRFLGTWIGFRLYDQLKTYAKIFSQ